MRLLPKVWIHWTVTAALASAALPLAAQPAQRTAERAGAYRVTGTWTVGGEGRWDYATVDPAAARLYVTRQSHVQVIDVHTGKLVADLTGARGTHGVALAPDLNRGFISDGQGNAVIVFDLKTAKELGKVPAGQNPDAIFYDAGTRKVLAFNGRGRDVTVIDATAEPAPAAAVGTIALDAKPEFAAGDGQGHVFVNLEDKSSIAAIDIRAMKVEAVWKIEGGDGPSGLAFDAAHHHLFAGCDNKVMAIVDSESGKTLGTVPIGQGVDACGFDPSTGDAFASCGDGTLTVVRETAPGHFEASQTVQTRRGARTMALDTNTHSVYLPTAEFPAAPGGGEGRRAAPRPGSFMVVVVSRGGSGRQQ